jgi:hypothetical protein
VQAPINTLQQFLRQVEDIGQPKPSANAATQALLPVVLYLGIHVIEGETVTPMLLAQTIHD